MKKVVTVGFLFIFTLMLTTPAWAQVGGPGSAAPGGISILTGAAIGAGLVTLGAAFGIGRLASAAYESMARQPEVAGRIFPALIIAAALIEGFTFYALYICQIAIGK